MPTPPSFRKTNPADQPIMFLNLTSDTQRCRAWMSMARPPAPRISMVDGVAGAGFGAQKYAVQVQLDPDALAVKM